MGPMLAPWILLSGQAQTLASFTIWGMLLWFYVCNYTPAPPKVEWGYTGFTPMSVRPSVRPSVCRQGFRNFLKKNYGSIHFIPGIYHRENSPVTQTTPEPTLLSWGGWPRENPHPPPLPLATWQAWSYRANRATQTLLFSRPLILLRCVTEVKFAQNLRWLGNWH